MEVYKQLKSNTHLKSVQVYEELKEELIMGQWSFGENINVNELTKKYEVSRRPVMEALKVLEKEGFIEIVPQHGCRVVSYSKKEAIEVIMLRSTVEALCVELATLNHSELEMRQFKFYQQMISESPELLNDKHFYLNYNREFHAHILMMSHSKKIQDYILQIWGLNDFYLVNLFDHFQWDVESSLNDHSQLLEAMESRDVQRAKKLLADHFDSFMRQHLEALPS